jgi:hypothetical protein
MKLLFPYIKILLTALHKLKPIADTVYRGVKSNLAHKYPDDESIVWWGFTV